jgi:hypothetical protein
MPAFHTTSPLFGWICPSRASECMYAVPPSTIAARRANKACKPHVCPPACFHIPKTAYRTRRSLDEGYWSIHAPLCRIQVQHMAGYCSRDHTNQNIGCHVYSQISILPIPSRHTQAKNKRQNPRHYCLKETRGQMYAGSGRSRHEQTKQTTRTQPCLAKKKKEYDL